MSEACYLVAPRGMRGPARRSTGGHRNDEPLGPVDIGGFGAPARMLEAQVGLQRLQEGRLVLHSGLAGDDPGPIGLPVPAARINSTRLGSEQRGGGRNP